MKISDSKFGLILTIPGIILVLLLIGYPLSFNTYVSLFRYSPLYNNQFIGLQNFFNLFHDRTFLLSLGRVSLYVLGSTSIVFTVGLIQAHCLSRIKGGVSGRLYRMGTIIVWAVPLLIAGIFWASMFSQDTGIVNYILDNIGIGAIPWNSDPDWALLSVIIADSWRRIPFMTILVLAGLEGIPKEIYESARIDGADKLDTFRYISFPINRSAVLKATVLVSLFTFRAVAVVFSMTGGGPGKGTYVTGLYLFHQIWRFTNFRKAGAIGVCMVLISFVFVGPILYYLIRREEI